MIKGIRNIVHPVANLAAATELYRTLLGVDPYVNEPYYVGFRPPGAPEVGLDPNGHPKGMSHPVTFWQVDDAAAAVKELVAAGAREHQPVKDVGGGALTALVRDADGNMVGLFQAPSA
ncbi:VOC family protein [Krasilnikovia sp. MM14-A1259]|uniref:VOC family protein n=1 Tax=Krasilnikovia sp. MM14-A1259 TaxID=3373539 RepID=UPI0037FC51D9